MSKLSKRVSGSVSVKTIFEFQHAASCFYNVTAVFPPDLPGTFLFNTVVAIVKIQFAF